MSKPPFSASRRAILRGMAPVAAGAALLCPHFARTAAPAPAAQPFDAEPEPALQSQPFHGRYQAGITTPRPSASIFVAFDVLASDGADLRRLMRLLAERAAFLASGGNVPQLDPLLPPVDSLVMGPEVHPDNLTITVAVGASLFDQRFGLAAVKPAHLTEMAQFPNDALDPAHCHGDLLLQICGNSRATVIHALRDIIKHTPDLLSPRWKMDGFLPPGSNRQTTDTVRNMLGFKDGTSNIDARDRAAMEELVWVGPSRTGEPAWTHGGSYMAVRLIRNLVERWDRTPLQEQQSIFGREKISGAPLGMKHEQDIPDYASDPHGYKVKLDSHIRLANPRTPETRASLIMRRPYNYDRGVDSAGRMDMGLLFCCYQADLAAGFISVQNRLNGEALEEYIKPFGGGYFFALPGIRDAGDYYGRGMLDAVRL
jgi:deferrochelatase/peroxidase EfeB